MQRQSAISPRIEKKAGEAYKHVRGKAEIIGEMTKQSMTSGEEKPLMQYRSESEKKKKRRKLASGES